MIVIAATGHRPDKLGGYSDDVADRLRDLAASHIAERKPNSFISGMALGWDMACAEASLGLGVPLIAAVPFKGQEKGWPSDSQKRYDAILGQATRIETIAQFPSARAFQRRNEWMVKAATEIVALWNGTNGGTRNCVIYAEKRRVPITNLWPQWIGQSAKTAVVNVTAGHTDAVYIGRPSKWGNPFVIGKDGNRAEVIAKYRQYLIYHPELIAALGELRGRKLACHCAPLPCHGDILAALADDPFVELLP